MKPRVANIVSAVSNLFELSLKSQLRPGDSFGVWTFRTNLQTGEFPLQKWTSEAHWQVRDTILTFIAQRPYDRRADYDELQLGLERVVRSSALLTVFIITSGDIPVRGTPFDERINSTLQTWSDTQAEKRQPVVIMLRGVNGEWTAHAISPAPFPLELPSLPKPPSPPPDEPHIVVETKPKSEPLISPEPVSMPPVSSTPEPRVKVLPPLIVSGKKDPPKNAIAVDPLRKVEDAGEKPAATNKAGISPVKQEAIAVVAEQPLVSTNALGNPAQSKTVDGLPSTAESAKSNTNEVTQTKPVITNVLPAVAKPESIREEGLKMHDTNGAAGGHTTPVSNSPMGSVERDDRVVAEIEPRAAQVPTDSPLGEESAMTHRMPVVILAGLGLTLVVVIVVWMVGKSRSKQQPSLITRSFERKDEQ